jgi:hypothetical protein
MPEDRSRNGCRNVCFWSFKISVRQMTSPREEYCMFVLPTIFMKFVVSKKMSRSSEHKLKVKGKGKDQPRTGRTAHRGSRGIALL